MNCAYTNFIVIYFVVEAACRYVTNCTKIHITRTIIKVVNNKFG